MKKIPMLFALLLALMMTTTAQAYYGSCCSCNCCQHTATDGNATSIDTEILPTVNGTGEDLIAEFTPSGWAGASLHPTKVTTNTVTQCDELVALGDFTGAGPEDDGGKIEFFSFVNLCGEGSGGMGLIYQSYPNDQEVELFSGGHLSVPTEDKPLAEAEGVEKLFFDGELLHVYTNDAESVQDTGIRWVVWHDADTGVALQWDEESQGFKAP